MAIRERIALVRQWAKVVVAFGIALLSLAVFSFVLLIGFKFWVAGIIAAVVALCQIMLYHKFLSAIKGFVLAFLVWCFDIFGPWGLAACMFLVALLMQELLTDPMVRLGATLMLVGVMQIWICDWIENGRENPKP
eukprot:3585591-Rhodomonas_salina.2